MVELTLKKAEEMCHIYEESRKQTIEMGGSKEAEVSLDSIRQSELTIRVEIMIASSVERDIARESAQLLVKFEKQQNSSYDSKEYLLNCISLEIMNAEFTNNNKNKNELVEHNVTNNVSIGCKIHTGAQCNVLPAKLFENPSDMDAGRKHKMQNANVNLIAYAETKIEVLRSTQLNCVIRSKEVSITFPIVNTGGRPILGFKTCSGQK
ncbi:hypothetical protein HHI36_009706 [Cryptolaemus montrouzieri]|uniref:Uncharacterized protein n=1 Tax=Cryptolaemus montrouzieri TaxID=559131 RepID=A0ABD2MGN4_9CUCU